MPGDTSSVVQSVHWVEAALSGKIATAIAVIFLAFIGVTMLTGRLPTRRGIYIIFGCFVIFSSSTIARGLIVDMAAPASEPKAVTHTQIYLPSKPTELDRPSFNPFDPYAGASVPQRTNEELPGIH